MGARGETTFGVFRSVCESEGDNHLIGQQGAKHTVGRQRKSRGARSDATRDIVGTYDISTGTAEVVADDYRPGAYVVHVNGVPSSHIVPGEPRALEFEYMRWMAAALERGITDRPEWDAAALRVTHLGGGACTMARYLAAVWPGSRHTVVELDAKLGDLARRLFDIPRSPIVKIRAGEARAETENFLPASRDIIIRDVFAGATTPQPLTTVEFFQAAQRSLTAGGIYIANCGDHSDLAGAKAEIAGMREVFAHVSCIADPPMLKGRRYGNIILIGSDEPLFAEGSAALAGLGKDLLGGAVPAHFKDEAWTARLSGGASPRHDTPAPRID